MKSPRNTHNDKKTYRYVCVDARVLVELFWSHSLLAGELLRSQSILKAITENTRETQNNSERVFRRGSGGTLGPMGLLRGPMGGSRVLGAMAPGKPPSPQTLAKESLTKAPHPMDTPGWSTWLEQGSQ